MVWGSGVPEKKTWQFVMGCPYWSMTKPVYGRPVCTRRVGKIKEYKTCCCCPQTPIERGQGCWCSHLEGTWPGSLVRTTTDVHDSPQTTLALWAKTQKMD